MDDQPDTRSAPAPAPAAVPDRPRTIDGLEINEVRDGLIVYDATRDRVHYLNATASLGVRKTFRNGMWASLSMFITRDSDHLVYYNAGTAYDTTNAPQFGAALIYGVPLERYFQ
jgi:hypothetical protein